VIGLFHIEQGNIRAGLNKHELRQLERTIAVYLIEELDPNRAEWRKGLRS